MKRLIFCFDGTWNTLDTANVTNVVTVAESIIPVAVVNGVSTTQIIHYDSGVGTSKSDHWTGGLFGGGLMDKLSDAYTFLVFNYEPGDEIVVFGFSRGAFTARAFVGFVRNLGIIERRFSRHIAEAVALYEKRVPGESHDTVELMQFRSTYSPELCIDTDEEAWRVANVPGYKSGAALIVRIKYLGVWDTVAAMGVPSDVVLANLANQGQRYFDSDLSSLVVSGRHAVSIDESRVAFSPTLWPNVAVLNQALGFQPFASDAPYQQQWWPGDHGSVGGGGNLKGLSDGALAWILRGAETMGLVVDPDQGSPLYDLKPNPLEALSNTTAKPGVLDEIAATVMTHKPRSPGPAHIEEISEAALVRWRAAPAELPEKESYRPHTLSAVAAAIDAATAVSGLRPQADHPPIEQPAEKAPKAGAYYTVVFGDNLTSIAEKAYGQASEFKEIESANCEITDPDLIYRGQKIFIPLLPV